MKVKEAREQGYKESGYTAYERGYTSRKNFNSEEAQVCTGRKGLFYRIPCWNTSSYVRRVYLTK